jgi:hypothetical protein
MRRRAIRAGIAQFPQPRRRCARHFRSARCSVIATICPVGISEQNLSLLHSDKVKGVRFSTLQRICTANPIRMKKGVESRCERSVEAMLSVS